MKINKQLFTKEQFIKYAITAGFILVLFGLLFITVFFSHKKIENNIKQLGQSIINEKISENAQLVNGSISSSCYLYKINSPKSSYDYAAVMRITTIYGPLTAVFEYDSARKSADFISFVNNNGFAKKHIENNSKHSQIDYWNKRVASIITKSIDRTKK